MMMITNIFLEEAEPSLVLLLAPRWKSSPLQLFQWESLAFRVLGFFFQIRFFLSFLEMMGESTFEFSVNEYSWQPKVNILVFSFLSNLTPGSKVSAPEELEPYLRMLHGKQSKILI